MANTIKIIERPHCYVCGKEATEIDYLDGPDFYMCDGCYSEWHTRCFKLLEQMKEEKHTEKQ